MVFEEVGEDDAEDFTYKEDPVEGMVTKILGLEQQVATAQKAATSHEGKHALEVARVLLAKAKFEQAAYNERQGRSKKGEADRLLGEWQAAQDKLDALNDSQITDARAAALSRFDRDQDPTMDADTVAQLRRHAA